jgi:serine phosphatase RsbU (regulator of sigma subunit)
VLDTAALLDSHYSPGTAAEYWSRGLTVSFLFGNKDVRANVEGTPMSGLSSVLAGSAVAGLITAISALLGMGINGIIAPEYPAHTALPIFVLGVAIVTYFWRLLAGLLTGVFSYLTAEYFFIPPIYVIELGWDDVPLIATFLATTLIIDTLRERRLQAEHLVHLTGEKMRVARAIQQRLFPVAAPTLHDFDIAGASFPAEATGGDYFDYIPMRDGAVGIVLGDVSGHGFGSALLMAETRAYLRALALAHDDVSQILSLTNRFLVEDTEDERFLTVFFVRLDPHNRSFVYAGAGHEGYLVGSSGKPTVKLPSTSLPLGLDAHLEVPCASVVGLAPGEILLLVSDGLAEAQSPTGGAFGIGRVLELVHENRSKPAREIIDVLVRATREYSQCDTQYDDMTVVILKRNET